MIKIDKEGVNFCTCIICNTSFFFDKADLKTDKKVSKFPFVVCPYCKHEMKLGWNKNCFKYLQK